MQPLIFEKIEKIHYRTINLFYKAHYKKGTATKSDWVFTLRLLNTNQLIACAKIKHIEDQLLLTGVVCDPLFQNQGVASYLIKEIQAYLTDYDQALYCFPYCHLTAFYQRLGFTPSRLPHKTIELCYQKYNEKKPLLLLEYR